MIILAIETSCDDTGVAVIKCPGKKGLGFDILVNIVSSQVKVHRKWGGVYPTLAKREHQKNLIPVLKKSLEKAGMLKISNIQYPISNKIPKSKLQTLGKILEREKALSKQFVSFLQNYKKAKIDAIAVTVGPGLEPCLWIGVNFAKALSYYWNIPIIPVNHVEAHIFANFINKQRTMNNEQLFPAICLIVSGGHTQLILMRDFRKYKVIGETKDDAAGECFDKTAKILGLPYPGGPAIADKAKMCRGPSSVNLPRPMIGSKDYDFSFSGLKTAVLYDYQKRGLKVRRSKEYIQEMCFEIQQAIIDVLIKKTIKAAKDYKAKSVILGGGVAANQELRKQFVRAIKKKMPNTLYLIPDTSLCTDNAAMVGAAAYFHLPNKEKENWKKVKAKANLRISE